MTDNERHRLCLLAQVDQLRAALHDANRSKAEAMRELAKLQRETAELRALVDRIFGCERAREAIETERTMRP